MDAIELAADGTVPTLSVVLVDDAARGWNLRLDTTNLVFAPEHVLTDTIEGEGHAHLYIDEAQVEADLVVEITITNSTIYGVGQRVEVELGSIIQLTTTADVDEEVHVNGYDKFLTLTADEPAVLVFEANIAGVFERRGQRTTGFEVS